MNDTLSLPLLSTLTVSPVPKPNEQKKSSPPVSNTGAQTALLDWLSFTLPDSEVLSVAKSWLGEGDWTDCERGGMGYKRSCIRGHARIYYDGSPGMGTHVVLSGQACREFEGSGVFKDWGFFLESVLTAGFKIARLDIAFDDRGGLLTLDRVRAAVSSGSVVSRWKTGRGMQEYSLRDGEQMGETVYFGSPSSDMSMRIYDKGKQMRVSEQWVRMELQARNDRATGLARLVALNGQFDRIMQAVSAYIDFKQPGSHSQRERWPSASWWSEFLDTAKKLRLSVAPVVKTLERVYGWLMKQVAPSLALFMAAVGGDLGELTTLLEDGRRRWSSEHYAMLSSVGAGGGRWPLPGCGVSSA